MESASSVPAAGNPPPPQCSGCGGAGGAAEGGETRRRGPGTQAGVWEERSWYLGESNVLLSMQIQPQFHNDQRHGCDNKKQNDTLFLMLCLVLKKDLGQLNQLFEYLYPSTEVLT